MKIWLWLYKSQSVYVCVCVGVCARMCVDVWACACVRARVCRSVPSCHHNKLNKSISYSTLQECAYVTPGNGMKQKVWMTCTKAAPFKSHCVPHHLEIEQVWSNTEKKDLNRLIVGIITHELKMWCIQESDRPGQIANSTFKTTAKKLLLYLEWIEEQLVFIVWPSTIKSTFNWRTQENKTGFKVIYKTFCYLRPLVS